MVKFEEINLPALQTWAEVEAQNWQTIAPMHPSCVILALLAQLRSLMGSAPAVVALTPGFHASGLSYSQIGILSQMPEGRAGQRISRIKQIREWRGIGLKEAVDLEKLLFPPCAHVRSRSS